VKSENRFMSFVHAFRGLKTILRTEHNARIHLAFTVAAFGISWWLRLDAIRWSFIILAVAGVWTAEAFNTVLEIVVDMASPEYSESAKRAKDIASAGVLIAAMTALILGVIIFGPVLALEVFLA